MATGRMSWQYHNQKHLPTYGLPGGNDGAGDMQDMHLKMSKKIAQLTKVIYALNTKNDEHEAAMLALKDAHEEEMQQMLTETASKIQQYRLKIGNELDLRRKIQNLEECVGAFEREKKQALIEIDAHSRLSAEREVNKEREYEVKINQLTRELREAKTAFELRIHDFEAVITNLEKEKHKNMDSVTSGFKQQVDSLKTKLKEQQTNAIKEKETLINIHESKIQSYEKQISALKDEILQTTSDADAKIEKAKAFYERELMALRASSISDVELSAKWLERESELKAEASRSEMSLRNKLKEVSAELDVQHEEVAHLTQQLQQSKSEANSTADHVKDLREQMNKLQKEYRASVEQIKNLQEELIGTKSRADSQAGDILRKSNIIGTLEAIKLTQTESIQDLEAQLKDLKHRLQDVEAEKSALEHSQSNENSQLIDQLKILSKRIDTITEEKASLNKQFKRDLEEMKVSHDDEIESLKQQFEKEADSMSRSHQAEVDMMKNEAQEGMDKLLHDMQERIIKETAKLETEKASALASLESEKQSVEKNLQNTQKEIGRLNDLIRTHESGLGDASSHINSLKSRITDLENELKTSEVKNHSTDVTVSELREELKQQQQSHDRKVIALKNDHQVSIENTKQEVNRNWEEEMRAKLADLESRLTEQHREDRRKALHELEFMKQREIEASKSGWEEQIKQLTNQMSEMRHSFDIERHEYERKLEANTAGMTEVERKLRNEAQQAANEYSMKVKHLVETHEMALVAHDQRKEDEMKTLQSKMESQHREEMHSQMRAQQISIESVKEKLNREKADELERKEQEFQQDMDDLRSELSHQHASSMDDATRHYEGQLAVAKSEFDQLQSTKQRNEERFNQKLSDLETDLRMSSSDTNKLRDRVTELNEMLSTLRKEIEQKGKEILHIRSEANMELRHREEELTRKFRSQQDGYEADNIRQKQAMVYEFNKATEILKDKLSSLTISLREAEDKYQRRESRPEDLDLINQLKSIVRDREEQIQKLMDDKKFFQMELVNRETNFNKVFTSSPNVGVLNPRSKKKSNSSSATSAPPRFTSQFVNVPNLSSLETAMNVSNHRLEPLRTGSSSPPGFNKRLQPTPPPHPKKFLR